MDYRRFKLTNPHKHHWLMVTGTPRSGTTFLGDMLSQSLTVNAFIEPFNPHGGIPWVEQRYLYYPGAEALDAATRAHLEDFFAYRFSQQTYIHYRDPFVTRWRKRLIMGGNQLAVVRAKLNPLATHSLIKDPIAVFLTEVFLELRPLNVFAMVRHPLSYAGSLKRLKWGFKLEPLLAQPGLRSRYLHDFGGRDAGRLSTLEASAWIWLAINRYLLDVIDRRPEVDLIFHEEMSLDPLNTIRACYARAGLPWDAKKEERIRVLTQGQDNGPPPAEVAHDFRRQSRDIFAQSVALLTEAERATVLEIVAPVAEQLYEDMSQPELTEKARALSRLST